MRRIFGLALAIALLAMATLLGSTASAAGGAPVVNLRVRADQSCEFKATGSWRGADGAYRESMRFSYWAGGGYTTQSLQQSYEQTARGRVVKYFQATPSATEQTWKITFTVHNSTDGVLGSDEIITTFPCSP